MQADAEGHATVDHSTYPDKGTRGPKGESLCWYECTVQVCAATLPCPRDKQARVHAACISHGHVWRWPNHSVLGPRPVAHAPLLRVGADRVAAKAPDST